MIALLAGWLLISPSFSSPFTLTQEDFVKADNRAAEWNCFWKSQIKELSCERWLDDHDGMLSNIHFIIETENETFDYGNSHNYDVCDEERSDILSLLNGQNYFCVLGRHLSSSIEDRLFSKKLVTGWIYECFKTKLGETGHNGFGMCLEEFK